MVTAKSIVFVSLFLGLTAGQQQVEVAVDPSVAAVELRLDGDAVAHLDGPPWVAEVDFGPELAPHRLAALAYDRRGAEAGRAEQWINLPRPRHELRLLLERERGRVTGGRLAWDSLEFAAPASVRLQFDGAELAADDAAAFALPRHDPSQLHVLSAEAVFPDGGTARADAVFGGRYGEETATELTAVPVVAGRRLPRRPERAAGWLTAAGQPARVVAIDRGAVDLYAVVDEGLDDHLEALAAALQGRGAASGAGLRVGDRLFLVNPRVDMVTSYELFGVSQPLDAWEGGSAWLLATRRFPDRSPQRPQRLADAVAISALSAAAGGRPRAVVLLLGPDAADASEHPPQVVRRFLDRLRVPLAVWYVEQTALTLRRARQAAAAAAAEKQDRAPAGVRIQPQEVDEEAIRGERRERLAAVRARWGAAVVDLPDVDAWTAACADLRRAVARQGVLWIEGAHPPAAVALGEAPQGVRLVGVGDAAGGGRR